MTDAQSKPPRKRVRVEYTGADLIFKARWSERPKSITFDSDGVEGPSPMDGLLMSLAACMAVDVRMILEKSRVPVDALVVEASGIRREAEPRRFTSITLDYRLQGPADSDRAKVERAVSLSREKYCSVLHTLDPDLDVNITVGGFDPSPIRP